MKTLKIVSKIFGLFATLATVLVLIGAGMFVIPRFFNVNAYIVKSGSMEPKIQTGSVAFIDESDKDVAVGDIITYKLSNGECVIHRIIEETENGQFVTKGDANDTADQNYVSSEQIVGTYLTSIPKIGFVLARKNKILPLAVIWVVALNLLAIIFGKISMEDFEDDDEEAEQNSKEQEDAKKNTEEKECTEMADMPADESA